MGDSAERARISRPALHLVFATKLEIFDAVIQHETNEVIAEIRAGLLERLTLMDKLLFACETAVFRNFKFVRLFPAARDMFTTGFASVATAYRRFQGMVDDVIDKPLRASGLELAASDVTRPFVPAIRGFPALATDVEDVRGIHNIQCSLLLAATARERPDRTSSQAPKERVVNGAGPPSAGS